LEANSVEQKAAMKETTTMKKLIATTVFVGAMVLLLAMSGRAADSGTKQGSVDGIVVPDNIHDRQPFSFSAQQVVEGEVVDIKTVEGEVVQRRAADKYGRVFLAAGLPAGAYLISRVEGRPTPPLGQIQIVKGHVDQLERTGTNGGPICVPPAAVKLNDAFALSGRGFSPNFADMQVSLADAGQTQDVPVLAATAEQLKLGPVRDLKPGAAELQLTNKSSGRSAPPQHLMIYDLQGRLERKTLTSGEQTVLELTSLPEDVPMKVRAVISGKATFSGGRTEVETVTEGGRAAIPVEAKRGSGNFHIDFEGKPVKQQTALAEALPLPTSTGKTSKAACSCGCGGTAQPRCVQKECSCSK
jgi:hypothetical protein